MTDDEKKLRALLGKTVDNLLTQHAKIQGDLDGLKALLEAEPTVGAQAKQVVAAFVKGWESKYRGEKYVPAYAKDIAQAKRMLKTIPLEDLFARLSRFFASDDHWISGTCHHSFGAFVATINQFGMPGRPSTSVAVTNCRHQPPCGSDQEHTRRYMAEMRQ